MTDLNTNEQKLSNYDLTVLIDASGSMNEPVKAGATRTRWQSVQETAVDIARTMEKLDADGIDVVRFSGAGIQVHQGVTADKVKEAFIPRPSSSTPLAEALTEALKLAGKSDKKDLIVVFTDGVPDDERAAAKVIIDAANRQENDDDLTILFVQVGDDAQATAFLRKLDDNLTGAKFDIVDVKTVTEVDAAPTIIDLLAQAIND